MKKPGFSESAFGLFIGVTDFTDADYVSQPLAVAARDATDLKRAFTEHLAWKSENIELLTGKVTRPQITAGLRRASEKIRALDGPTVFVLYISTHGHLSQNHLGQIDRSCLLAYDTSTSNPVSIFETGLTGSLLGTYVASTGAADRVVILDTCYAARSVRLSDFVQSVLPDGTGAAILASGFALASYSESRQNSDSTERLLKALQELAKESGAVSLYQLLTLLEQTDGGSWVAFSAIRRKLSIGFVGEAVAQRVIKFREVFELATARVDAYIANARNYVPRNYVRREKLEEKFQRFLKADEISPVFTIVGAAGSGKTTTSLRLAELAREEGFAVVWLPSSEVSPSAGASKTLVSIFSTLGQDVTDVQLFQVLAAEKKPLVAILDAVNEWETDRDSARLFLESFVRYTAGGSLKLALTCRSRDWDQSARQLLPWKDIVFESEIAENCVSAEIGAFEGGEMERAEEIFGRGARVDAPELKRQPLFVRMISRLGERMPRPHADGMVRFVDVFDASLDMKLKQAAARVTNSQEDVRVAVLSLVRAMYERGLEVLPTHNFLDLSGEALGLALIDCGLFRRVSTNVAVDAEMLHEYLLSLEFAGMTATALKQVADNSVNERLMQGALLFDLARMDDPTHVIPILEDLTQRYIFVALDLMPRLTRPDRYTDFYVRQFNSAIFSHYVASKLAFVLERNGPGDIEFSIEIVRALFQQEHYYDWERKRWPANSWSDFMLALQQNGFEGAKILATALEIDPEKTMGILFDVWLADSSGLRESPPGSIQEVAVTFLSAAGRRNPDIFTKLLSNRIKALKSGELYGVWDLIRETAPESPEIFKRFAEAWLQDGHLNLGAAVLRALPAQEVDFALSQISQTLQFQPLSPGMAESLVGVLAYYGGPKVFRYLDELAERPRLRNAALRALKYIQVADPQVGLGIAARVATKKDLDQRTLSTLADFYCQYVSEDPEAAVAVFRRALANNDTTTERDIALGLSSAAPHGALTAFIYERLNLSPNHRYFEFYSYYVKSLGDYGKHDMQWLRRSVASDALPPKFEDLAKAKIEFALKGELVLLVDRHHSMWWSNINEFRDSKMVQSFAKQLCKDSRFEQFSEQAAKWIELIAAGKKPREATDEVRGWN